MTQQNNESRLTRPESNTDTARHTEHHSASNAAVPKKKKNSALLPLLGILIIIGGIILIPSLCDSYSISGIDKDTAASKLENTETRLQRISKEYDAFVKAPSTEKTSVLSKIPETKALGQAAVLKELETTAGSTGTSIVNIGFREANDLTDSAFGAEEIALSITGSQEKSLLAFVDGLEKAPRMYHIQSFTINKTDTGLTGDIRALLYYHKN